MNPTSVSQVLGYLEHFESQRRGLDAARLRLIAVAVEQTVGEGAAAIIDDRDREIAYRALRSELALALRLGEQQLESQMRLACELSRSFRATMDALEEGAIDISHARVIVDAAAVIGTGHTPDLVNRRAGYEGEVLETAMRETPNRLRPVARRLAEQWADRSLDTRHQEAIERRRVVVIDCEDGMSDLIAHLPSIEAHAIKDRLTRIARSVERGERTVHARHAQSHDEQQNHDEQHDQAARHDHDARHDQDARRSRDQLRADVLADLLLASDERTLFAGSTAEALQAQVQLVIEATPAAGATPRGEPGERAAQTFGPFARFESAELLGCGPLDLRTAAELCAETEAWDRVTIDPADGSVLRVDRYRPSAQMRRFLGARDRHCRFPGCRMPAHRCDLDHTIDAARGGATSCDNLAYLCRGHHIMKHHGGWRASQVSRGVMRWTSPAGRQYVDRPPGMFPGANTRRQGRDRGSQVRFTRGDDADAPF